MIRRGRTALLGALPLLFLALAFYFPLWQVLSLGLREEGRWTFSRVLGLLEDPYVRHLLLFTLKQAALSTALSFILGFPLGWFLARYRFPGRRALRSLTLVPFVLPPITVALGFLLFFGEQGYFNRWIMGIFGLPKPPLRLLYTLWAVVLAHAFYNAPLFARFVDRLAAELKALYAVEMPREEKLRRREEIFLRYREKFAALLPRFRTGSYRWFLRVELNNAVIIAVMTYHDRMELFERAQKAAGGGLRDLMRLVLAVCPGAPDPFRALEEAIAPA